MILYKFRPLANQQDFERAKVILETGHFWCSYFWELNDPMEGFYTLNDENGPLVDEIFCEKNKYKICSFSDKEAFESPIMWGYYANGFRGIAIEVANCQGTEKVKYQDGVVDGSPDIKEILLSKLNCWQHEQEWRFLEKSKNDYHRIGEIRSVYFGAPYENVVNYADIRKTKSLTAYIDFKGQLESIAKAKNIECHNIRIIDGEILQ